MACSSVLSKLDSIYSSQVDFPLPSLLISCIFFLLLLLVCSAFSSFVDLKTSIVTLANGRFPIMFLVVLLIILVFFADPFTAELLLRNPGNTMVLPLFLSTPNTSVASFRRRLERSGSNSLPNARMRLYDDLLLNGYYTTRLWIGTPPQQFALIVDTGSTVTYVPCSTCEQCGKHQDPKFQPDLSSTYQPLKCNLDCDCDEEREVCVYDRQYAEMSSSSGVLGKDIISFGNQSELLPQRAVFGCENMETGDIYSQHADGIMGLGSGDLSVVDQLVEKGVISDSFSLCYGGMSVGGGAMILGGISPPEGMIFSHSDPVRSPYYNVDLKEIQVAGKKLHLDPSVFDRKHGTILDSGTTYAYFPKEAFEAFKNAIENELQGLEKIRGPDPSFNDICFLGAGSDVSELSNTFPVVDLIFGNGKKFSLSPENYLFRHSKVPGAYCLGIFLNEKDSSTLLGGIIVRNTLVTYDREHEKIGFWKTNCLELWEKLHISGVPPPATSIPNANKSTAMAPMVAPTGAPHFTLPEGVPIGTLTLELLFNVGYADLKTHFPELIELIAPQLNFNISQVHLLNATPSGNNSLVTLVLFPLGSAEYISNTSAMMIITKLAENRIQLPPAFGSYQLIKWKVDPLTTRTQQRQYAIVVFAVVISIIGLTAWGMWFVWRRRQESINSYKPVEAAIPEQELQPM